MGTSSFQNFRDFPSNFLNPLNQLELSWEHQQISEKFAWLGSFIIEVLNPIFEYLGNYAEKKPKNNKSSFISFEKRLPHEKMSHLSRRGWREFNFFSLLTPKQFCKNN